MQLSISSSARGVALRHSRAGRVQAQPQPHLPQTTRRLLSSVEGRSARLAPCQASSASPDTQTKPGPGQNGCTKIGEVNWDLDWFHYTPFWYKPHYLIIGGISFIVGCNLGTTPCIKTTLIASAPVAVGWFIFLWMVPRQFADFAKKYIESHPECEEHARQQQAELTKEVKM